MADNYSMFSALSDVTEDLSELTLKLESQEFKEKKQKAHSVHNINTNDNSSIHSKNHRKNNSNASNLLSPPWEKKHNRRSLSDGNWNIKKENPSKNDKNEKNSNSSSASTLKAENKDDLSRTPSLPSKWSIKRATLYKTELCRAFEETGKCKFGDECIFAHSEEELRPRVDRHPKYKTRICRTFWEQGECPYGKRCCFIHTERDITHPDDFSVFEAQMQQQYNNNLSASSLLNGSHRRMQSAPEIAHKHRPSNSSDTFMGGIYNMTPLDRRSIHSEKSSIRSFDTTKESSKLKEEIKINNSSDEESLSESENPTPSVVLMDETGSITEIIKKPKKTQRITKFLKVGHKSNNNNNLDVNMTKNESTEGKNKSKWFSRNKNNQNKEQKEKKSKEESSSTGRKILSFGRKDKDKEKEKDKDQTEKPEKEKHSKFFPFVRSHSNNDNNESVTEAYSTPTATPPPLPTADFSINTNALSVPPPLPSPPLEKASSNLLAADALFGNTEPAAPVDEKPKTEEAVSETKEKDKKKNKNLTIDASQPVKLEEVSSPRRFIPNFLLSAISKNNSQKEKEEK